MKFNFSNQFSIPNLPKIKISFLTRIGLVSDTHSYLDPTVFEHFKNCDEIWHAGDFGSIEIANKLMDKKNWDGVTSLTVPGLTGDDQPKFSETQARQTEDDLLSSSQTRDRQTEQKPHQTRDRQRMLRGVYGNIDGYDIKSIYPEQLVFMCEEVKVMMRHIGGYPPRYNPETKKEILIHKPQLFISGHSHILKIMYDGKLNCLHMNPGAAGKQGWQKVRTLVRFVIDGKDIKDCEVIEL